MPNVSIIIPSYNRRDIIELTLDSVQAQTYQEWECLVVDDGSTDETESIIAKYVKKDSRFSLIKRTTEPKGAPTCRNIGLLKSSSPYIIFLDSDDILAPWCLENRLENFQDNLDFIVFPQLTFKKQIGDTKALWQRVSNEENDFLSFLKNQSQWQTAGAIIKRQFLIEKKIRWMEGNPSWQDWEFFLKILFHSKNHCHFDSELPDIFIRRDNEVARLSGASNKPSLASFEYKILLFNHLSAIFSDKTIQRHIARTLLFQLINLFEQSQNKQLHPIKKYLSELEDNSNTTNFLTLLYFKLILLSEKSGIQIFHSLGYRIIRKLFLHHQEHPMKKISDQNMLNLLSKLRQRNHA